MNRVQQPHRQVESLIEHNNPQGLSTLLQNHNTSKKYEELFQMSGPSTTSGWTPLMIALGASKFPCFKAIADFLGKNPTLAKKSITHINGQKRTIFDQFITRLPGIVKQYLPLLMGMPKASDRLEAALSKYESSLKPGQKIIPAHNETIAFMKQQLEKQRKAEKETS